ncbi:hypothetical protein SAMN04488027_1083 [Psychroflexus sediminis]|uniref:Uncharacterized protein n=1 Tax=Psychroflexus sediminis TaxID=470826 RepID=A0A1G7XB28_9FLAO|nr:hypothetical protein SAMN04488027_1083 [Psychroflexus sediminis]
MFIVELQDIIYHRYAGDKISKYLTNISVSASEFHQVFKDMSIVFHS